MNGRKPLFSSAAATWATPFAVKEALYEEFSLDFDPCPLRNAADAGMPLLGTCGLHPSWEGKRVFCNPPYGRSIGDWLAKAYEAEIAVFLVPSRTDTRWWHQHAMHATEIRFLKGRLKFGGATTGAPFPSVVLVYAAP